MSTQDNTVARLVEKKNAHLIGSVCSHTNLFLILDVTPQVAVGHVGQDDHGVLVVGHADAEQRQHVRVVEVLHDDALLQERLDGRLLQPLACAERQSTLIRP